MKLDEKAIRAAYRDETRRGRAADCPGAETLARAADLPPAEREALVSHLATCSDCSEELQMARPFLAEKTAPAAAGWSWRLALPLAAAVLLAAGVVFIRQSAVRPVAVRGAAPAARTSPADGARLTEAPAALEWTSAPSAETFEIVVFDAESTEVWHSAPSGSPRADLPQDLRSSLRPATPYYWRVLAARGVERSTSSLFRFEIAPTR